MKKHLLIAALACCGLITLAGCQKTAETRPEPMPAAKTYSPDQAGYEAAMAAANAELKKAKTADGEWRDTGKMLKAAQDLAAKGDFTAAVKTAEAARFQAVMGQQQAADQANAGNPDYITR